MLKEKKRSMTEERFFPMKQTASLIMKLIPSILQKYQRYDAMYGYLKISYI